ncbi:hypothetical protein NHF48_019650 [Sphingomonas sp. H160509]|uniref:hypothetical protein n=1 Tax=Sphingomonas sp. H160509 TaxID=2955313 RepID=UPI002096B6F5|nr:hypothetical protein [Sphingomonas sp. H160509]MDD1452633.1 hypothetical protein [Sphingomonas sp. H160509]
MSALFVAPLAFTDANSPAPIDGTTVGNLNNDKPGYVWRGSLGSASFTIDLGPDPVEYDTIALVGSNLRASDGVRVQTGTTTDVSGYDSGTVAAWAGKKPKQLSAKTIALLPSIRTDRYVRVTITAPGHPRGYVQAQRLVIGAATRTYGVKFGAKVNFEDRSPITIGPGFEDVDRYDVLPAWDITTTGITDAAWRETWFPLLLEVGSSSGLLFVRDNRAPRDLANGCRLWSHHFEGFR